MSFNKKRGFKKQGISRRKFLQWAGILSTTALTYNRKVHSGIGGYYKNSQVVVPQDNLIFDKEMKVIMSSHPYNCGGRCQFKLFVKNGRILKITSAGDIPREGSELHDESIDKPQFRACPKGYAQIKRTYQPDRLKYPLIQTKKRGDLSGFKRASWETAFDTLAEWYDETVQRQDKLGYIPAIGSGTGVNNPGFFGFFGPFLTPAGAPSYDNFMQAKYGSIGHATNANSMVDILNSKFVLSNGCDQTVSFSHQYPNYWYFTKAKEMGIPIVIMDTRLTDAAVNLSSGYTEYGLPPYILVRPQSDPAVFIAMASYVWHRKKSIVDEIFLKKYSFGFYRDQNKIKSLSTLKNPLTGGTFSGQEIVVPEEMTFQYYLEEELFNYVRSKGYSKDVDGVIKWASDLSGVPQDIIVKLALAYFETKPSCLYGGWGTMRSNVGIHHGMILIALAAMAGQTALTGGGPGYAEDNSYNPAVILGQAIPLTDARQYGTFYFSANKLADVILTGLDWRSPEQLRADALSLFCDKNGVPLDLGEFKETRDDANGRDGRLRIEMIAWDGNRLNQRGGPIGKLVYALTQTDRVKHIYGMDHFMTSSLMFADMVLPQTTHHEEYRFESKNMVQYMMDKAINPMYESKMADDIKSEVLKRLGINYGKYYSERDKKTELDIMKAQWEGAKINPHYLQNVDPSATLPDFETFRKKGIFQLNVPRDKSVIGVSQYATSGVFPTDTGKINFISPYYYYRDKDLGEKYKKRDGGYYRSLYPPKPMYVEPVYGYEQIHEGKYIGLKGLSYSLQLVTAHHRRRAHSVYDNVAILKDQFPGIVDINEIDATQRGIKQDDVVYVYNDWGCVKVKANVTKRIIKGTCRIADGEWYRPSLAEIYTIAWKDYNSKGKSEDRFGKYDVVRKEVPVDVGGAPNTLMHDIDVGFKDPALGAFSSFDNSWNGHLVEISKIFPGDK